MNQFTPLSKRESSAFVKKLQKLRNSLDLSVRSFAIVCNTKESTMRAWLLGNNPVSVEGKQTVESCLEGQLIELDKQADAIESFLNQKPTCLTGK